MKRLILFLFLTITLTGLQAQGLLDKAKNALSKNGGGLTENEAGMGIKEALSNGITNAVGFLHKPDGFLKSELYKILLPPEALKMEKALRNLGMGKMVDDAITQINRGAEDAVGFAVPIFADALKQMTLTDALNLLRGGKTAATDFFRSKTSDKLKGAFKPVIDSSLQKTNATKYYGDAVTKYNSLPTTFKKANPDLSDYVTGKAIEALFSRIAVEEANIRDNPAARTSDLLKKVFGSK
jgi:Protein of unknown function (DUF4197)